MSRYVIPAYHLDHLVVVGFDNVLETFFLQVDDRGRPDDADHCMCWLGQFPRELPNVAALAEAVRPYARLSPEATAQLQQDYEQRTPPTPLQRHMLRILQRVRSTERGARGWQHDR